MDFEQELERVAERYRGQGYQVVVRPGPQDLPAFAKDFHMDLVGRRGSAGVLVKVKETREAMAADHDMPRYAEIIGEQPGWRFDFVILRSSRAAADIPQGDEPGADQIAKMLSTARTLSDQGHLGPALTTAWAGLEASMRRLLANGEKTGWGNKPREMLNELFSGGFFSADEFSRLETAYRLRNEIAHGFLPQRFDAITVQFLTDTAQRLLEESQAARHTAG